MKILIRSAVVVQSIVSLSMSLLLSPQVIASNTPQITQAEYEGRPQYRIQTDTATYWYDIAGGGFSRLIDSAGRDWINFSKTPLSTFPESAAAGYRGLPNFVYGGETDAGAGHPGFDQCTSSLVKPNCIRTETKSGKWAWQWTFTDRHATCEVLKVDSTRDYWFLYEGPVGGKWSPSTHYFGTDQGGPSFDQPDGGSQTFGKWRWAYFGDKNSAHALLLTQIQPDDLEDTLWYLGNSSQGLASDDGMIVFGFGRGPGTQPLLQHAGLKFRIGLLEVGELTAVEKQQRMASKAAYWIAQETPEQSKIHSAGPTHETAHDQEPERWRGPDPASGANWPLEGHWFERSWFQMGDEFNNPPVNDRFRVNGPYVATHPEFHTRSEPRGNGQMLVALRQLPRNIDAARLYLELWGGHPGSTNRRVSVNGRSTYGIAVPHETHCTHAYRHLPVLLTDLVYGDNSLQFNVDGDQTFWGHFIVEEAAIDALLPSGSETLQPYAELVKNPPTVDIHPDSEDEKILVSLNVSDDVDLSKIERVDFEAWYDGFDENGDGRTLDWHGMTKRKQPLGHLGTAVEPPFACEWNTQFVEAQDGVKVRARVIFRNNDELAAAERKGKAEDHRYCKQRSLVYQTAASDEFSITHPAGIVVKRVEAEEMSIPFWSRADRERSCVFDVPATTSDIVSAQLDCVAWDGGAGEVKDYFQLAGESLEIAGDGNHDVILSKLTVSPKTLHSGRVTATLRSDTHHHGIEILYPGPNLTVRYRAGNPE